MARKKITAIQRIRDAKRYFKPQQVISAEEWEEVEARAAKAKAFFEEDNLQYQIMKADLVEVEQIILTNRIKEVQEVSVTPGQFQTMGESISFIPEQIRKIFITPKKVQVDELIGQYKYIKSFFAEMQTWIDLKDDMEKKESEGVISIERSKK